TRDYCGGTLGGFRAAGARVHGHQQRRRSSQDDRWKCIMACHVSTDVGLLITSMSSSYSAPLRAQGMFFFSFWAFLFCFRAITFSSCFSLSFSYCFSSTFRLTSLGLR